MGTTNFGNQTLRFDYNQEATSSSFNERFYNVIESGIYSGGLLTKNPSFNNKVSISPMHVYIYDDTTGLACHIETSASVSDIVVSQATPWIVLSFDWADATDNYMDVLAVSYTELQANDDYIVVGRAFYISGVLQDDFDYTYRKTPGINYSTTKFSAFRVKSLEDAGTPKRVSVEEGLALVNNTLIDFSGGTSSDISDTGAQGRYDVIYVSLAGNVEIIEGTPDVSPTAPSYPKEGIAVAEIRRGANRNTVNGADIFQVDPDRTTTTNLDWGVGVGQADADIIPLGTDVTKTVTGGTNINIADTTYVRAGIQAVVDAFYNLASVANDSVLERHINWGHAASQVGAEDIPFTSGDFTATYVDTALQELYDTKIGPGGGSLTGYLEIAPDFAGVSFTGNAKLGVEEGSNAGSIDFQLGDPDATFTIWDNTFNHGLIKLSKFGLQFDIRDVNQKYGFLYSVDNFYISQNLYYDADANDWIVIENGRSAIIQTNVAGNAALLVRSDSTIRSPGESVDHSNAFMVTTEGSIWARNGRLLRGPRNYDGDTMDEIFDDLEPLVPNIGDTISAMGTYEDSLAEGLIYAIARLSSNQIGILYHYTYSSGVSSTSSRNETLVITDGSGATPDIYDLYY